MARTHISKDPSCQTAVAVAYGPLLTTKFKTFSSLELPYSENIFQILPVPPEGWPP